MGSIRDRFSKKANDDWVEWLSDDEPPKDIKAALQSDKPRVIRPASAYSSVSDEVKRSRLKRAGATTSAPTPDEKASTVSINIHLPELHLPKIKLPYKSIAYWGAVGAVTIGVSIGARALVGLLPTHKSNVAVKGVQTSSPSFTPVAPSDKPDLAKGSTNNTTSYDATRQLFSYIDTYLNGRITVSQQILPESFKNSQKALADVAATIGATRTFETAFGTVYVATSSNDSSQRLVFVHKDLLVLMESNKKYDDDAWKYYIENLR